MTDRQALSLEVKNGELLILDQQMLPASEEWIVVKSPDHMIDIIKGLKVRGAPLIGVAASLSLALWYNQNPKDRELFLKEALKLKNARPTAVNLMNAIDRLIAVFDETQGQSQAVLDKAFEIFDEDVRLCDQMAETGSLLIDDGDQILTHCNTGGLATVGVGTALGVIIRAHEKGKKIHVYVDETRPLLQGGRLTTWELEKAKVPYTLICDNMSGSLMAQKKINKVFLGADRIAINGDFANKIGTYNLAVLCHHHQIPFYTVAPQTTIDPQCLSGENIEIEMRSDFEVRGVRGSFGEVIWSPIHAKTYNPAFDVTPIELVTGMVLDHLYLSREQILAGAIKKMTY